MVEASCSPTTISTRRIHHSLCSFASASWRGAALSDTAHMILDSIVPVFFVMALGYLAGWTRDIDNHHVAELNALVMDFALPASLFVAMVQMPRAQLLQQSSLMV